MRTLNGAAAGGPWNAVPEAVPLKAIGTGTGGRGRRAGRYRGDGFEESGGEDQILVGVGHRRAVVHGAGERRLPGLPGRGVAAGQIDAVPIELERLPLGQNGHQADLDALRPGLRQQIASQGLPVGVEAGAQGQRRVADRNAAGSPFDRVQGSLLVLRRRLQPGREAVAEVRRDGDTARAQIHRSGLGHRHLDGFTAGVGRWAGGGVRGFDHDLDRTGSGDRREHPPRDVAAQAALEGAVHETRVDHLGLDRLRRDQDQGHNQEQGDTKSDRRLAALEQDSSLEGCLPPATHGFENSGRDSIPEELFYEPFTTAASPDPLGSNPRSGSCRPG